MRPNDYARAIWQGLRSRAKSRGEGRRIVGMALAAGTLIAPGAALASTGCDAVNAGVLNFTTSFTANSSSYASTAISVGSYYTASALRTPTYTALPTSNRFHPTRVTFSDGEVLTFTITMTGIAGDVTGGFGYAAQPALGFTNSSYRTTTTETMAVDSTTQAVQAAAQRVRDTDGGTVTINVTCLGNGDPEEPTIGLISPAFGAASGPAPVTITGTNFSASGNTVRFGGTAGAVTAESASSITVTPPARAPGFADVVVTTADARSVTVSNGYSYLGAPTVTAAFSPTSISSGGSSTLTLTLINPNTGTALSGVNLAAAALPVGLTGSSPSTNCPGGTPSYGGASRTLSLSGAALAAGASCSVTLNVSSSTPGTYSYTTGAPSAAGPVGLTGAAATTPTGLTVTAPAPVVTSVSPSIGPVAGGTAVTLTGANFTDVTGVAFGGLTAAFTPVSATQIAAVSPEGVQGTVSVTVTGPGGTSATGPAAQFTYAIAPVAADRTGVAVPYSSPGTAIDLSSSITGGDHDSITIASGPSNGTVSVSGDVVTYTPAAGYFGADSFTYTASGPGGVSLAATVSVMVAAPAAPVATDRSGVGVVYNSPGATIDLSASITGVHNSITIATPPSHGAVGVSGSVVTYTPNAGYFGADSFSYTATGPGGTSAPATVSLTVATPGAPVASDRSGVAVPYGSSGANIDLSSSITGVHSSIAIATGPIHGAVSISGDVATYTPTAGYFGADSFTYTATGPGGTSAPATVSLTVATPGAPVASNRSGVAVAYGSSGAIIDLSSSITGVHSSIAIATVPSHGSVSISGDVATYTPNAGYFGADSFTYTAIGPGGPSAPATVGLVVDNPPAPTARAATASVAGATPEAATEVSIDLSALVTGEYSEIRVETPPSHGVVVLQENTPGVVVAVYAPRVGFAGSDSFTYVAQGPGGTSSPAAVTIQVAPLAAVASSHASVTGDGQTVSIDLTAGASGGPFTAATIVDVTPADAATAVIVESGSGEARTFRLDVTPDPRFGGAVGVTYTLSNAFGPSAPATVTVTVEARPDPTLDPTVRAISQAQVETTRRFARSQVANFMRRNEQLHGGGGSSRMGVTLSALAGADRHPLEDGPRYIVSPEVEDHPTFGPATSGERALADEAAPGSSFGGDRIGGPRQAGSIAVWTGGAIEIGERDAESDSDAITARTSGVSFGADIKLNDVLAVGIGGGYGRDSSSIGDAAAHVRSENRMVAAYGSLSLTNGLFLDGVLGGGDLEFRSWRRSVEAAGIALGDRDGRYTLGALSFGLDSVSDALSWSLYGRAEALDADLKAYVETGAGRFNLRFDEQRVESLTGTLGARLEWQVLYGIVSMTPNIRIEWNHEFGDADAQWLDYADIAGAALYGLGSDGWSRDQLYLSVGNRVVLPHSWMIDFEAGLRASEAERSGSLRLKLSRTF